MPRRLSLRARLFWLVALALLPIALLAVAGLALFEHQQRERALLGLQERARAIASAVDLELQASIAALELLALSPRLDGTDLSAFYLEAKRAERERDAWDGILILDTLGRWVLSTRVPWGTPFPGGGRIVERDSYAEILLNHRPAVGPIARGPGGRFLFPVRVAVARDGHLRYVLTALVSPQAMQAIVERQKVPGVSVAAVFDSALHIVARSRDIENQLGKPVTPSLRTLLRKGEEGMGRAVTREGEEYYAAFARTRLGNWGVVIGVPPGALGAPAGGPFALYAAGAALSLLLGAGTALWLARRIAQPIARLRESARAATRGALEAPPDSGIPELDEVGGALADAVRELQQLNATLEARVAERTRELQRSNEELESFSYSVSHDLRAPLRAMDGYAALLLREVEGLPPQARQRVQTVRDNAQRMGRLIDGLLAFSRLSRQPVQRARVDVAALARDCVAEVAGARAGEVEIGPLPPAQGDPLLLRQVLSNLIANALKFSAQVARPRIEIGARDVDGATAYFVRDNGVGFDMRHAGKLFGVFQRLHREDEFEGTGVGLALVQRIVQRHGGRVWAEAAPGRGATFFYTLGPAAAPAAGL